MDIVTFIVAVGIRAAAVEESPAAWEPAVEPVGNPVAWEPAAEPVGNPVAWEPAAEPVGNPAA